MDLDLATPDETRAPGRRGVVETTALVALCLMIVAVLSIARELLVPLALAVLLSFVLAPLVRLLRRVGLPRGVAVVLSVLSAFALLFALGWLMTAQVSELVRDLPRYQETVQAKIASLKGATATSEALRQVSGFLETVGSELETTAPEAAPAPADEPRPLTVQVLEPQPGALSTLAALITPLLHPFAITGIVIIFVIFILLQREDLRNRFIKLIGTRDLQKTTEALDDAARRLSRLLLIQLAMNTLFGIAIGTGLWIIGVPIPVLWGILAAVLRFVPYIGAIIGAALPLALAAAVDPGWTMLIWTAALFAVIEPLVGHFIEPLAYGRTTGLSPVAVVVAATFWTWLWGPIGLLLATPLTVCLVVLGRHVKGLSFLEVLLGDRPALSPPQLFYQRALAGDSAEMVGVAEEVLRARSLSEYYDQIAVPGLRLALEDSERGLLGDDRAGRIRATVEEVVEDLDAYEDVQPDAARPPGPEGAAALEATADRSEVAVLPPERLQEGWTGEAAVLCIAAESALDEAAALMLRQLVAKHGIGTRSEGADALSARRIFQLRAAGTRLVCLVAMSAGRALPLRHAVRRLRRRLPGARIMLVMPGERTVDPAAARELGIDETAASFQEVLGRIVDAAARPAETPAAAPADPVSDRV
ncbi:AI-2E family transporter [Chthonobacter rhizosphaerae]|uniref:AI-2E family transporter n=1 Tax=Chthonobacter rhizosphaerae TaxID=2735553 RepID=UPI0015EE9DD0|nr:AI-2E family transporter [Chthonobacter rhizosphaerae]